MCSKEVVIVSIVEGEEEEEEEEEDVCLEKVAIISITVFLLLHRIIPVYS